MRVAAGCLIAVAAAVSASVLHAQELQLRNDPFQKPPLFGDGGPGVRDGVVSTSQLPVVRAVMIAGDYRSANVNGKALVEGDMVGGYRVHKILEGEVVFRKNESEYRVMVFAQENAEGSR